jgi:AcrR family transcriptional regulator
MADRSGLSGPLIPAPGRGQYDRRQSREARISEQRWRLLSATALAFAREAAPTIASVVTIAGVSRNTFYEYFDDLGHARAEAAERARRELVRRLRGAEERTRTPVERLRALIRAWLEWATAAPADAALGLQAARDGLAPAARELEAALTRASAMLRASGVQTPEHDALRMTVLAAGAEALARRLHAAGARAADGKAPRRDIEGTERTLVEAAVRLLR